MGCNRLTAIDLFAGCGGLTEGLRQARFHVLGAIEVDSLAATTYRANHRNVRVWSEDIRQIPSLDVSRRLGLAKGRLDLLAGCPPCQGFSAMRTKNGHLKIEDERNDLIHEFLRFVRDLFPKMVMMENVPGLVQDGRFSHFLAVLKGLGYRELHYAVHNARHYAVPQRRRRLILMASRVGPIQLPEKAPVEKTVRDAIGKLPKAGASGDPPHDLPENRTAKVIEIISSIPKDGGSRTDLPAERQLDCHRRCNGFKDVYGRMAWDDVGPTITGGCFNPSKGRFLHPLEDRCITMREAALIQSFPPDYRFPDVTRKQELALLIGNALPPEMIKRFAAPLRRSLLAARNGGGK